MPHVEDGVGSRRQVASSIRRQRHVDGAGVIVTRESGPLDQLSRRGGSAVRQVDVCLDDIHGRTGIARAIPEEPVQELLELGA